MFKKDDLRITKTYKALLGAMFALLNNRNFNAIKVNDLCSEAVISRATFYTHFNDKYDLFKYFLEEVRKGILMNVYKYEELEKNINEFIYSNKKIIKNILKDANSEIYQIIQEFISSIVCLTIKEKESTKKAPIISFF